VFVICFKAGENPFPDGRVPRASTDEARLESLLDSLVDVPLIMNSMRTAIGEVARSSRTD